MSRKSADKNARRKKRQSARNSRWLPDGAPQPQQDEVHDPELVEAVQKFEDWITERGWAFDLEFSSRGLASWYYEPSVTEFDDEQYEVVTRVWFTVGEYRDEDFPNLLSAVLVGTGGEDDGALYTASPDQFIAQIEAIEAYRPGDPVPVLG